MTDQLAATQPGQETAAPTTAESAPAPAPSPAPAPAAQQDPEWYVKRIGEYTAKAYGFERRALAAETELAQLRQKPTQQEESEPVKTLEDFGYDSAKYGAYLTERVEKAAERAADRRDRERREQEAIQRRRDKFHERETAYEKVNPDYRQIARNDAVPVTKELGEMLMDLDDGPELLYELGKDLESAHLLSQLPPHVAVFKLAERLYGKRQAEATKAAALEAAKSQKAVSNAPPPPPKIDGGNAQVEKDPADMTDAEFARWRRKQIAARR